jgi:hypothetical protein
MTKAAEVLEKARKARERAQRLQQESLIKIRASARIQRKTFICIRQRNLACTARDLIRRPPGV